MFLLYPDLTCGYIIIFFNLCLGLTLDLMLALEYNIINWLKKFLKVYIISLKWDSDLPKKNLYIYFNERRLKMIKNTFYFMLKAIFVLEIFTFLSLLIGYVEKWLDRKAMVNFKSYDITDWTTWNYNTHIVQYLQK